MLKDLLNKEYAKVGEVAKVLNVSVKTVQNYCNDGKLKCVVPDGGGNRLVEVKSVKKLMLARGYNIEEGVDVLYDDGSGNEEQLGELSLFVVGNKPNKLEKCVGKKVFDGVFLDLFGRVMNGEINRIFIRDMSVFGFGNEQMLVKYVCEKFGVDLVVMR